MTILFDHLQLPQHAHDIARILNDYDHELFLERLPDNHPYIIGQPNKPFAVIHRPMGLPEYVVESYPETMLDHRLLATVFEWDTRRFGKQLDKFDALTAAKHIRHERARADELGEAREKMKFKLDKQRWE